MTRHLFVVVVLAGTIATWALGSFRPAWTEPLKLGAAAPEITGGPWIGSPPLTTAALRGRVVLVEFWTFG